MPPDSQTRRDAATNFYRPLAEASDGARRVGWESEAAHRARLNGIAAALQPLSAYATLLDAGCGEGALLPVLRAAGFNGIYVGVDILPYMVAKAETLHSDDNARFEVCDAFLGPAFDAERYDAVICSGALNTFVTDDHDSEVCTALSALWNRSTQRLVVDLAVSDRQAPGAGIARTDLLRAWHHARSLTPVVVVREDGVPGEALLQLSHSRATALAQVLRDDPRAQAALLLAGDEATAAAALVTDDASDEGRFLAGCAALATRQLSEAETIFRGLADGPMAPKASLQLASVLWLTGRKRAAESLLYRLAATSDEARFHLVELLSARRQRDEAERVIATIGDGLIAREARALVEAIA